MIDGVEWLVEGAQVAIVQRGRVLLQFRPWPPGWELPGGHCDPGEDPADTAKREVTEENRVCRPYRRHRGRLFMERAALRG